MIKISKKFVNKNGYLNLRYNKNEKLYISKIKVTVKKILILFLITIIAGISSILACYIKKIEKYILKINDIEMNSVRGKVCVYLSGAVNNVGVYSFDEGITLKEAINLSGGVSENADISDIDLDGKLKDLEKIYIPYVQEEYLFEEEDDRTQKVNINTALEEELMLLEGIGESTARKIVSYRQQNKFEKIEDIMNVPRNW